MRRQECILWYKRTFDVDLGSMAKESLDHIGFAGFYREMERGIIVLKIPDLLRPICVRFVSTIQIQRLTRKSVTPREYTFFNVA